MRKIANLVTGIEELKEQLVALEKAVKQSPEKAKDVWDKLSAVPTLISRLVLRASPVS